MESKSCVPCARRFAAHIHPAETLSPALTLMKIQNQSFCLNVLTPQYLRDCKALRQCLMFLHSAEALEDAKDNDQEALSTPQTLELVLVLITFL